MLVEYHAGDDDELLLRDYACMDAALLPIEDENYTLLTHHTNEQLRNFYKRHKAQFDCNQLLVSLPERCATATIDIAGVLFDKEVFPLDNQQYIFVDAHDCSKIAAMPVKQQLHFQKIYDGRIYPIVAPGNDGCANNTTQRKRTTVDATTISLKTTVSSCDRRRRYGEDDLGSDSQALMTTGDAKELMAMLTQWKEEHDSVLSRNYELQAEIERYKMERELVEARHKIELQEMELNCHRQLQRGGVGEAGVDGTQPISMPLVSASLSRPKHLPLHGGGSPTVKGITRVSEWIGENRYGQAKLLGAARPSQYSYQKWDGMFDNPNINAELLLQMIQLVPSCDAQYRVRLVVPLTYLYNLRSILQLMKQRHAHHHAHSHWDTLIAACPADYRVVLFALKPDDAQQAALENTRNCVTLATHLHFIMVARYIDRSPGITNGKWKTRCDSLARHPQSRFLPDLSILEEHYPASLHFGGSTLLTFNMCLRVKYIKSVVEPAGSSTASISMSAAAATVSKKNGSPKKQRKPLAKKLTDKPKKASAKKEKKNKKKNKQHDTDDDYEAGENDDDEEDEDDGDNDNEGAESEKKRVGTGNNKNCQMCCSLAVAIKKTGYVQPSHHPKRCHALAVLSNNEADILNQLILACSRVEKNKETGKRKTNTLPRLKFYFGTPDGKGIDKDLLRLDSTTLLRHATAEELASGQHVNGLRLNRPVYMRLRQDMYDDMRAHLDGDLMFGTMDQTVQQAMDELDGLVDLMLTSGSGNNNSTTTTNQRRMPLIRQLIYDSDGLGFLKTKFDKADRPHRSFSSEGGDDGLFFALDPATVQPTTRMVEQQKFFHNEQVKQAVFLQNYAMQQMLFEQQQYQQQQMGLSFGEAPMMDFSFTSY